MQKRDKPHKDPINESQINLSLRKDQQMKNGKWYFHMLESLNDINWQPKAI